jgi:copper chaperone CopZ
MKYVALVITLSLSGIAYAAGSQTPNQPLSCGADLTEVPNAGTPPQTRVVRFRISGMLTPNCPKLVEAAARRVPGVTRVDASLESRSATVEYREGRTTPEKIRSVIVDQTGFQVEVVKP